jgi:hypothetical protein
VVFRDTDEANVPPRPIAARNPGVSLSAFIPPLGQRMGLPLLDPANAPSYFDFNRFGLAFDYPDNWSVDTDDSADRYATVTVYAPGGGFWSMGYAHEEPPGKYRKNIRFIKRGKSGLITPDEDLGEP